LSGLRMGVQCDSGEWHVDPSGGLLWVLMKQLGPPDNECLGILPVGSDGMTYMQALRMPEGTYDVSFQEGQFNRHYRSATRLPHEQAHHVLLMWALGRPEWRDLCDWVHDPVWESD